jgi:putative nucleotidyltransferase with HDIG domain
MKLFFTILFFLTTIIASETKEFRVGIYNNPPKIFLDVNDKPSGFFVDILDEIASKEKWHLKYVKCEWRECLLMLEEAKIDIMPDVAYTKEREKHFKFNKEIILSNWSVVFTNKKNEISSILDLNNKKTALLEHSIQQEQIQETFKLFGVKPTFILTKNYDEAFSLVQKGMADAVVVNRYFGELQKERYNLKETPILLNPAAIKFAFANAIDTRQIADKIDLHIKELKQNKESLYYKSIQKWLSTKEVFNIPTWLKVVFVIAIAFLIILTGAVAFFRYMLNLKTKEVIEKSKKLHENEEQKIKDYENFVYALVSMIEQRDSYTAGHSQRVAKYSLLIAKEMGYSIQECELLFKAATLHDIGKIATSDSILLKPDKLSKLEYNLIKEHVNVGVKMLKNIPMFKGISHIIKYHHEKYNGSGYPDGLSGNDIPELSRIMMVADAFDAMTTNRIYKHKKSVNDALAELKSLSKIHYHPEVVDAAIKALSCTKITDDFNQTPITEIEQQRFAYFYKDAVTELYNVKYLETTLINNNDTLKYKKSIVISLHKFDIYNKKHGWDKGDETLKNFAKLLYTLFTESLIFRIRANDFIILLQNELNKSSLIQEEIKNFTEKAEIEFDFNIYDLKADKIHSYSDLKKFI